MKQVLCAVAAVVLILASAESEASHLVQLDKYGCPDVEPEVLAMLGGGRVPSPSSTAALSFIYAQERGQSPSDGHSVCMSCYQGEYRQAIDLGLGARGATAWSNSPLPRICSDLLRRYVNNPGSW